VTSNQEQFASGPRTRHSSLATGHCGCDEPLAMYRGLSTAYFHADGLGSITSLTNSAGSLAASYVYDSFGKLTA
jgi:hypothetical protein